MQNNYYSFNFIIFQNCNSNNGCFSIASYKVITLSLLNWISVVSVLLLFLIASSKVISHQTFVVEIVVALSRSDNNMRSNAENKLYTFVQSRYKKWSKEIKRGILRYCKVKTKIDDLMGSKSPIMHIGKMDNWKLFRILGAPIIFWPLIHDQVLV